MGALLALPLLKGIPSWLVRVLAVLLVLALLVGYGWFKGNEHGTAKLNDYMQAQAKKETRIAAARQVVTEKVVTQYITQTVPRTRTVTETIDHEVTKYVERHIDTASLSTAAVELHDAAAANRVPDTARAADGAASGLEVSAFTQTCTANYAICHQTADRLRALQEWNRQQAGVK